MSSIWQVQEAKNRFSELIDRAKKEGPQIVTRHGRPVAQVVALGSAAPRQPAEKSDVLLPDQDDFLAFLLSVPKTSLREGLPSMPRRSRARSPFGEA